MTEVVALGPRSWTLDRVPPAGAWTVLADSVRLEQAILNLAANAVQHTTDGAEIGVGGDVAGAELRLWVRDTGPGVPSPFPPSSTPSPVPTAASSRSTASLEQAPRSRCWCRSRWRRRTWPAGRCLHRPISTPPPGAHRHDADPDRRRRAADRLVPREGPAGGRVHDGRRRDGARCAGAGARRQLRPSRARPRAAGHGRPRGAAGDAGARRDDAGADPHRPGRRRGHGGWVGGRRRRLRHQALQVRGAPGADPVAPARRAGRGGDRAVSRRRRVGSAFEAGLRR